MSTVAHGATIPQAAVVKVELAERLEELGFEIDRAMAAIAGDRLHEFEQSVRRQELASDRLIALTAELAPRVANTAGASKATFRKNPSEHPDHSCHPDEDGALNLRLRKATNTIKTLNAQYSALLRHSGQSLRLLASLSGAATGYAGRSRSLPNQPKQQTWSCEV